MQVVSRGTIDEGVEELDKLRRDCSIVPCGTIASFATGFVGQPTEESKGSAVLVGSSRPSRFKSRDSFHVEHKQLLSTEPRREWPSRGGMLRERNEK